ncbi:MATE family efflux transporter [Undibacterium squillarum]|uniref:Multidrug-efflux transporter n=1 Tax=Undibacterium squillarum TaxID=1131567 RepID=A0ABQ2XUF0_9BURK|nr:MATE family efflux transporter [Undibacterium squillarum]GGX33147.1 MATE family efflux transporter [Undibacterium squillarum]
MSRFAYERQISALAWPTLIGQLATVSNGVIDTAMTSRYSATDLAALAIGVSLYVTIFVGLNGVLQAISPIIGQLYGAKDFHQIGDKVRQAVWLAAALSLSGCLLLLFPAPLLQISNAEGELYDKAAHYLQILALALPATLGFRIYSGLNNAVGKPKMVMLIQLLALAMKFPLNSLFIFGGFGIPAMGGPGCAVATVVISWIMLAVAFVILRRNPFYQSFQLWGQGWVAPQKAAFRQFLALGIPMGFSYLIEVSAYACMALFIARISELAVAGHQITANFGTILYMIPLSLASASSTLTAQAIGARDLPRAQHTALAGIRLALMFSVPAAVLIWLGRPLILGMYTNNAAIAAAAMPLLTYICLYQIVDGVQIVCAFNLRAYKVATGPTLLYALALWGCGLGGGYLLAFNPLHWFDNATLGAAGYWIANTAGTLLIATALLAYLLIIQRRYRHLHTH